MIVVDTSAVVAALIGRPPDKRLVDRLAVDGDLYAPHLLDIEFLHALRRLVLGRQLSEDRAADAHGDFADLAITRYEHTVVADRIWQLRHSLTAYDATFVALAELLDAPLVTCDARLARAPGRHATIELFADH
ncbi:MAG TPA: type II toxin-antitoxin system VapC family toxin [Actinomycetota bacterium]|nr:type II toxin-antitoxin system VapC family toxin [Actinomycetota bacterium]